MQAQASAVVEFGAGAAVIAAAAAVFGTTVELLRAKACLGERGSAAHARGQGADVRSVADIRPEPGVRPGKGEAMWKAQFVATGSSLPFIDADLTEWGPHFVTGLLGPLMADPEVRLVKGFYDRLLDIEPGSQSTEGGRVTEPVARALLGLRWPQLEAVVQPLAGEWAVRSSLFGQLSVPVRSGYRRGRC